MPLPTLPHLGGSRDGFGKHLGAAACAEFLGAFLFQLLGGTMAGNAAALAFTFAGLQYALKYVSGGHVNPAISLSAAASGHIRWSTGLVYSVVQVLGAMAGALMQAALDPAAHTWAPSPACIQPSSDLTRPELFGWEMILTFLFVLVAYASMLVYPGHGDAAPLATGVTLYGILATAGKFTGGSPVNPARTIASTVIFNCFWNAAWVYITAQLVGCFLAAAIALTFHGKGPFYTTFSGSGPEGRLGEREGLLAGDIAAEPEGPTHEQRLTFAPTGRP